VDCRLSGFFVMAYTCAYFAHRDLVGRLPRRDLLLAIHLRAALPHVFFLLLNLPGVPPDTGFKGVEGVAEPLFYLFEVCSFGRSAASWSVNATLW